jgi:methylase of polypeptide subunit release factors
MADAGPPVTEVNQTTFEGLRIRYDERVLAPRAWTALQSRWAASLLAGPPDGPVLELGAGAGQIGLAAVRGTGRRLVCIDRDPVAAAYARANAEEAGLASSVEVRQAPMTHAVRPDELFALVIADPPWVTTGDIHRYPEDPVAAIDGGEDGLDVARACVEIAAAHLVPAGALLLQLGATGQVDDLRGYAGDRGLVCTEVRSGERGVLALFTPDPA